MTISGQATMHLENHSPQYYDHSYKQSSVTEVSLYCCVVIVFAVIIVLHHHQQFSDNLTMEKSNTNHVSKIDVYQRYRYKKQFW